MDILDIKSCDSRTTLSFAVHSRNADEIRFFARISDAPFTGEVLASTYHNGPPTEFFDDLAKNWTGWEGQKEMGGDRWRVVFDRDNNVVGERDIGRNNER